MADVWEAQLSFDGFTYTPTPDPGGVGVREGFWSVGLEAVCLPILDPLPQFNPSPDDGGFCLLTGYCDGIVNDPAVPDTIQGTGAFQVVAMRLGNAELNPPLWAYPFVLTGIFDADPALLAAGGTLSITKDYDSDLMTFTGPLGTMTCSLTDIDALPGGPYGYHNTTPLRPRGYAHDMIFPDPTITDPAYDISDTVSWYNLIGKQNGVTYLTVALSAADPGVWWPIHENAFEATIGNFDPGLSPWWNYSQLSVRQKVQVEILAASYPLFRKYVTWKRLMNPSPGSGLDIASMDEHAIVFRGWTVPLARTDIRVSRSHDAGHSWTDYVAVSDAHPKQSVSLAIFAGLVYAVYYDETTTSAKQVVSRDLGNSWSSPVSISITGTNPRLVIADDGPFFYFSISGTSIVLQRSFDLGSTLADAAPILVATMVDVSDFAAIMSADRSLVVAYTSGSLWITRRSLDYGNTWATV